MLRVATFNIRHGRGLDGRVDLDRIAGTVHALEADVIGLQELDNGWPRSGEVDQPRWLADALGLHVVFHPTVQGPAGATYGIALAARTPFESESWFLPNPGGGEPRGAQIARIGDVTFVGTHLSRNPTSRRAQIAHIAERIPVLGSPVVLLGDLNTTRRHLGPLRRAGLRAGPWAPTMPARRARTQIDFVLAGRGLRVRRARSVATSASDHRPLVTDIE